MQIDTLNSTQAMQIVRTRRRREETTPAVETLTRALRRWAERTGYYWIRRDN